MRTATILLAVVVLTPDYDNAVGRKDKAPLTRQQFAKAISKVVEGMTQEQVISLLGRPNDIRTHFDPGGISTNRTKEIWRYGTSGHLTTATLGQVYMDVNQRVQYVFGKGEAPPDGLFQEAELRRLLRALDEVPSYNAASGYNPGTVIRAVNLMQPLGKKRALAAIQEYLRIASHFHDDGREGTFLVMRVLFDIPKDPGYLPRMSVGGASGPVSDDKKLLPRYPIVVEGDIPFLVTRGYFLAGFPEQPESHLAYFRKHGTIRRMPLNPTHQPFAALSKLIASPRWLCAKNDESGRHMLETEILRMMDSVFRVEPDAENELLPFGARNSKKYKKIIRDATALKLRWDPKLLQYTFRNGKTLPPIRHILYRRTIWKPKQPNLDVEIIVERRNARYVGVDIREALQGGIQPPTAYFRIFDVKSKNKTLLEFRAGGPLPKGFEPGSRGGRFSTGLTIHLMEGSQIQIEMTVGKTSKFSPSMQP